MPEYNFTFDWNRITTIGKVKILAEQVVGSPSQAAIDQAVAQYIEDHPGSISGLSEAAKVALLQIAQKIAYIDEHGQDYYNALYDAFYPPAELVGITAVYTQSGTVYDTDSLESLEADLVVTAEYSDGTSEVITSGYTLSGTLTAGTSTITVAYQGQTATFTVTVTERSLPEGYTRVEYVERPTGTANNYGHNTTGLTLNGTDTAVINIGFMTLSVPSTNGYFLGCKQTTTDNSIGFGIFVPSAMTSYGAFDGTACMITSDASIRNEKIDLTVTKTTTGMTVSDGTNTETITSTPRVMAGALHIFCIPPNTGSSGLSLVCGRIYYINVVEGGVTKLNMIPCKRTSDNAVGFYDTIGGAFRTSSAYVAGAEVE